MRELFGIIVKRGIIGKNAFARRCKTFVAVLTIAVASGMLREAASSVANGRPHAAAAQSTSYCARQGVTFRDPYPFIGIMDPWADADTPQIRNCSFGQMAADHVGYFREKLSWAKVESVPNQYEFAFYDELVAELARHGMRLLPLLIGAPPWRSTQPSHGVPPENYPPRHPSQFAYFASLCAQRYGPGGTFWRTHPQVPYYPVRAWEIWNEPNLPLFWAPKPDPAAYVRLLRASSRAIKRIDAHAQIVSAGMPFFSRQAENSFLTRLYKDGIRGTFDALGLHTYSVTVGGALQRLQTARAVMNRFGDRKKSIWLTEWGWAGGPPNPYLVNPAGQRKNIAAFLALVQKNRFRLGLREVMYFDWQDKVFGPGPKSYWIFHLGLFTQSFEPKPALEAFSIAARRLNR